MKSLQERLLDTEDNLVSWADKDLIMHQLETIYDISEVENVNITPGGIHIIGNLSIDKSKKISNLKIPGIILKRVDGFFDSYGCKTLTSLEGAPEEMGGDFDCSNCEGLTSLKGSPKKIEGCYFCTDCRNLKTLKGAPDWIRGSFYCCDSNITTLEGAPKYVGKVFNCTDCRNLTSLKGAPKIVKLIDCSRCSNLSDYANIPENKIVK